jgi:Cu/Ag efflux protein CusF
MCRIALIACLVMSSAALCGGVLAAVERTACVIARPANAASLQPTREYPLAAGRILAVDGRDGTLTVAHGPVPQFHLERMTRIFPVEDRAVLAGHSRGDKIRFELQRRHGRYVITRLENSN